MARIDLRGRSPEEIERETERTRASIAETIEEIQERLSPTIWRSALRDGSVVLEIVRRHPVPALLLGASALWLLASIARDPAFRPRTGYRPEPFPRDRAPARIYDTDLAATPRPAATPLRPEDVAVAGPAERAADDEAAARRAAAPTGRLGTAI